jgi:iron complex outermembrane recepter protein
MRRRKQRPSERRLRVAVVAWTSAAAITATSALAQDIAKTTTLDEVIVTATRVETNLQQTPLSVVAISGAELELGGIDQGRDLGIMVPNVVLNPGPVGELGHTAVIRGIPGVETYVDGAWVGVVGFLQRSFVELERVEVLRGPQGTLFGRNTNGGAVQIVTRRPSDEFGVRLNLELGEFDRRTLQVAADVPISDHLLTKWTGAIDRSDGFMQSRSARFALGDEDNTLVRGDILWRPRDRFSLRFDITDEDTRGSPGRIVRITDTQNASYIAYNVLAGNPDYLSRARAINPAFPDPPFRLPTDRFTAETHEQGFPGGQLGRWETRLDARPETNVDELRAVVTLDWQITDRFRLESLSSYLRATDLQTTDTDGSELTFYTEAERDRATIVSQELHLIGNHFNGRLQTMLGLYFSQLDASTRDYGWAWWEFAVPNTGPNPGTFGPPGVGGRPQLNQAAVGYVRAWGATVGNALAAYFPFTFPTTDRLYGVQDIDRAVFGQLQIDVTKKLDVTVGFRFTNDDGGFAEYLPAEAFRPMDVGVVPAGDPFARASIITASDKPDFGTVSTPKIAISYKATDDLYFYASYAEGFTSAALVNNPNLSDPILLDPEVVKSAEIGVRSDWLEHRLRLNATYFSSRWDGMRVTKVIGNPSNPSIPVFIPSDDGVGRASGLEAEVVYLPTERWELDFGLGLLDTEYVDIGDPLPNGTGLQPGIPFAYAPEKSYSLAVRYRLPLARGGSLLFAGDYGWMDEYQRTPGNETQPKNPDGSNKPEPAYGILNARIVYQMPNRDWRLAFFGTNLTNEWYVNGGGDNRFITGFGFGTIGRPREVGVGVNFAFH